MDIIVAEGSGFCSGVRRAVAGARKALEGEGTIYCLGDIIHNPLVVDALKSQGLVAVEEIDSVPAGSSFIIRSHGLPRGLIERAGAKDLRVLDFTCPKVKKIHTLVSGLLEEGWFILVAGNPGHPEVKAIVSLVEESPRFAGNALVVRGPEDLASLRLPDRLALVVQTTFDPGRFFDIVRETVSVSRTTLVCNTLCEETLRRQREALALSGKVDFIVVVGGKNSSNTRTLFETIRGKVPAVHVEGSGELDWETFRRVRRVGVISGASTPEEEVEEVRRALEGFAARVK